MGPVLIPDSHLVGRAAHLRRLAAILTRASDGVICLAGPPGVGKSALVAAALPLVAPRFSGAHFVDLAGTDRDSALARVRSAVQRVPARRGSDPERESPWEPELLIVDHAETLTGAEAAADAIAKLDGITILAMSTVPMSGPLLAGMSLRPLTHMESRRLLLRRAELAGVGLPAEGEAAHWLYPLAEASMGSPLLIGLLASRLMTTRPAELVALLAREHSTLAVLMGSPDAGHATALLPSLATFSSSFTAEAASSVSGLPPASMERSLAALMDLSLVHLDDSAVPGSTHTPRYRLPRLAREFLRGQAAWADQEMDLRRRHATHFSALARRAATHREACEDLAAIALVHDEYEEVLAALRWLVATDPGRAARLAVDLLPEADRRGEEAVVTPIAQRLLAHDETPEDVRRDGHLWLALLDGAAPDAAQRAPVIHQNLAEGRAIAERSQRAEDQLPQLMAELLSLGLLRDYERAGHAVRKGAEIAERVGHSGWRTRFEFGQAHMCHVLGDQVGAVEIGLAAWEKVAETSDEQCLVYATLLLSRLPSARLEGPGGVASLRAALESARRLDNRRLQSSTLVMLALHTLETEAPASAATWLIERYLLVARQRTWHALVPHILLTIALSARLGHPEATARLHGALLQWSQLILTPLPGILRDTYHRAVASARDALGPEFEQRSREGARLTLDGAAAEAIDYVLRVADPSPREPYWASPSAGSQLTARERDVLRLLVSGNRNKEIANQLFIAPKTVMHHTSAIYRKLGVRGRAEAAVTAVRLGLGR
ncbi:MAG TPA: LuxR C-terminal-related transcriptional regulator [Arachnia sp.]|nr:LuxR C-terminal-related transcriptional regulator [Arachnia sp.]